MHKTLRLYHKLAITIALYGTSWDKLPTLRDYINKVKLLESGWFYSEYLPKYVQDNPD